MTKDKVFYNENRTRYYGVRVGDRVRHVIRDAAGDNKIFLEGIVEKYDWMDNNAVYVRSDKDGELHKTCPEWLIIIDPVDRWFAGKTGDSIVTHDPVGQPETSQESMDHYGGYVIAESVPPPFVNLICAAPELLKALRMFSDMEATGQISIWSDKREVMNKALRIARDGKDK